MSRKTKPAVSPDRAYAPVFAALGDRTRLRLVATLARGEPCSIVRLTEDFHVTRQAVTKHLRVLENAGLVQSEWSGRELRFAFNPKPLDEAKQYLDAVGQQWEDALGWLKAFVEKEPG